MLNDADESRLTDWLASVSGDPLAFAHGAFPWGEPGFLEKAELEDWQIRILTMLRDGIIDTNTAVQLAVASGHGVGKSALVSIIILWAIATAPDTRGVVTANTETQLKTKTWAELGRWYNLFIARELFVHTATAIMSRDPARERTWRIDMIPWSEKNPAAFAGLHNKGRRLVLIMDEASEIPDIIHEVAEGAMTDADTEIIWLMFGNPTRNTGRFKEAFPGGQFAKFWRTFQLDSREVRITNKKRLADWIEAYGDDSDFVRIRVKGQFPRQGEMEFFSAEDVEAAATREPTINRYDPLALGIDVARYGKNASVIFPRKGRDARSFQRQRFQGLSTVQLADKIAEANATYRADGIMIDGGGVGGGVVDIVRHKALFCYEVQFGAKDDTPHIFFGSGGERYANKRSGMYGAARAWLKNGAIPNEPELLRQFKSIRFTINRRDEIQLISKEDMLKLEPDLELDDIDAFVLTFAHALQSNADAGGDHPAHPPVETEYDPFDEKRMVA